VANEKSASPTWIDVKAGLQTFDRAGLLGLLQDLYAGSKDNQAFLHARLSLGHDQLEPYKTMISSWICPDLMRNQPISVSKAKKAIAAYKKAIGHPEGLAELCFPQVCVRADRRSAIKSHGLSVREALIQEWYNGREALIKDGVAGASRFGDGLGARHGDFGKI